MFLLRTILLITSVIDRLSGQTTSAYGPPYTECPPPPYVDNSHFDQAQPFLRNDDVSYVCDAGYGMVAGDGRGACHIDGGGGDYSWDALGTGPYPPECKWIYTYCPSPENITNGYLDPTYPADNELAEYKCDYHYATNGTTQAVCEISADTFSYTWNIVPAGATDFPPACVWSYFDCPSPGAIANGYIDPAAPWADNDVMEYKCDPGFVLVGGDTGTCHISVDTFSYWWTYEPASFPDWPPSCVIGYDFCLTPGAITNGFISLTTPDPWAPTDTVEYECDSHYKMFGTKDAECFIPYDKQSYHWNTTPLGLPDFPPNCIYRYDDCPSPGDLVINGTNDPLGPWVDNQILDYVCDEHFIEFGADTVQCDISDNETTYQWHVTPGTLGTTFVPAVCKLATCGSPPAIENGMASPQLDIYENQSTVVFVCNHGYRIQGVRYVTCEIDMNVDLTWRWLPEETSTKGNIYPPYCYLYIPHPVHYIGHNTHQDFATWIEFVMMCVALLCIPILIWLIGCVIWWLIMRFQPCAKPLKVIRRIPFSKGRRTHMFHVKPPTPPQPAPPRYISPIREPSPSPSPTLFEPSPSPTLSPSPDPTPIILAMSPELTPSPPPISPSPLPDSPLSPSPSPSLAPTPPPPRPPTPPSSVRPKRPIKRPTKRLNLPNHPAWKPHRNPIRNDAYHMTSSTK